jgi:hypothetical protein
MRNTHFYAACLLLFAGLASCSSTDTTTSTTDSTTTDVMNPGDSAVTTTTTTTVTHHRYAGTFAPQPNTKYMDLTTKKQVNVRIDTERGIVNAETNEPVTLLVMPGTHDTIYGQTGNVVNNYIFKDESGGYRVDTVRINTVETHVVEVPAENTNTSEDNGATKTKTKEKGDKTKTKTK